jgi:hypothetical protein
MNIRKPIIIIGAERSGKSLLFSILANHRDLYWLSNLDSLWPTGTVPITLARRTFSWIKIDQTYITIPGTVSGMRGRLKPSECVSYWKRVFGWGNEGDYLIEDDYFDARALSAAMRKHLLGDLSLRVLISGKRRLIVEQAGFSLKILFFNALFPDAIFLHTIRNPFDNHDALVRRKLSSDQKLWGIKVPGWKELVNEDPSKQAAAQLRDILKIIDKDIVRIPDCETRFLRIRFEDLVATPKETVQSVLDFCGLDMTTRVLAAVAGVKKETGDQPGTGHYTSEETSEVLISLAGRYGYLGL